MNGRLGPSSRPLTSHRVGPFSSIMTGGTIPCVAGGGRGMRLPPHPPPPGRGDGQVVDWPARPNRGTCLPGDKPKAWGPGPSGGRACSSESTGRSSTQGGEDRPVDRPLEGPCGEGESNPRAGVGPQPSLGEVDQGAPQDLRDLTSRPPPRREGHPRVRGGALTTRPTQGGLPTRAPARRPSNRWAR